MFYQKNIKQTTFKESKLEQKSKYFVQVIIKYRTTSKDLADINQIPLSEINGRKMLNLQTLEIIKFQGMNKLI